MSKWKILVSDSLAENGKDLLRSSADLDDQPGISAEDLTEIIGNYDALIVRGRTQVTGPLLKAGKMLKVVGRAGVGVDNIDLAAAAAYNVIIVNSPTATSNAVAEHTFGLMLSLVRNIAKADGSMKSGLWDKKSLAGSEITGKTLGIVGMGRIGAQVAKYASAFNMNIMGYDPLIPANEIKQRLAQPVTLEDLYAQSDIITYHLPLNDETRKMVNSETISSMKRGVYLICAARGGIIDETALLASLESRHVAGAALDVFEKEPPGLTALVSHPNIIATPHIGAQTQEAQERASI
ncbi:MAG: hydroxyacid dehydrogenase, partial [Chloroflexota bacterium]